MGRVFITGTNGSLYMIDPTQDPGDVTTVLTDLPDFPQGITFDGRKIWTANFNDFGSVSIVTPGSWEVQTIYPGNGPQDAEFDGRNVWITFENGTIKKFNPDGTVALSVPVGPGPQYPAFDGANFWIPLSGGNALKVMRASDGALLKVFSAGKGNLNGLSSPIQAAFDGQRVLVTNLSGDSVSLFRAADLAVIGTYPLGLGPYSGVFGACSDGVNFWISFELPGGKIARF